MLNSSKHSKTYILSLRKIRKASLKIIKIGPFSTQTENKIELEDEYIR